MSEIRKAVVLAAGVGSRLRPLTVETPKCLTEVGGRPMLEQTLGIFDRNGIEETVVVVGHLGHVVIDRVGNTHGNMQVSYLWNEVYERTNSMYSAWLAREYLEQGAILIEGDTVFEEELIGRVLRQPPERTYWVVDRFTPEHDGCMSTADDGGRIIDLKIIRGKLDEYRDNYYKSTGVLKITPEYGRSFSRWLDDEVSKGNVQVYYDLVIAGHLEDAPIYICDFTGGTWVEIDTPEDLERANRLFPRPTGNDGHT